MKERSINPLKSTGNKLGHPTTSTYSEISEKFTIKEYKANHPL